MRCYPDKLITTLQKNNFPVYVLHGQELFLMERSADSIRAHITSNQQNSNHQRFDDFNQATYNTILHTFQNKGLFSEHALIEVRLHTKLTAPLVVLLTQLLSLDLEDITLIIHAQTLTRAQQQVKWLQVAEQKGLVVQHPALNTLQFEKWVQELAKNKNLALSKTALDQIIAKTAGNCLAAFHEISQLSLYFLDKPPGDQIHTIDQQSQFTVYDLTDAIEKRKTVLIIKILSVLKESAQLWPLIIWALAQSARKEPIPTKRADTIMALSRADQLFKTGHSAAGWRKILEISLQKSTNIVQFGL